MAKRKSKKDFAAAIPTAGELSHNPFASLAHLRDSSAASDETHSEGIEEPEPEPDKAPRFPGKLVVRMEKKGRRGKTVTRISGIPRCELDALAGEMKKALGCGAIIEEDEILLLGSLVGHAATWLAAKGATGVITSG